MDSCIGIGITSEALREGADCPADATFVPVTAANSRWNVRPAPVQVAPPAFAPPVLPHVLRPASRIPHAKIRLRLSECTPELQARTQAAPVGR